MTDSEILDQLYKHKLFCFIYLQSDVHELKIKGLIEKVMNKQKSANAPSLLSVKP